MSQLLRARKNRLLILVDEYPPFVWGGISNSVSEIIEPLEHLGWKVSIVVQARLGRPEKWKWQDISVRTVSSNSNEMQEICANADAIWLNGRGFADLLSNTNTSTPFLYTSRSDYLVEHTHTNRPIDLQKVKAQMFALNRAKLISTASHSEAVHLTNTYSISPERIRVIPNPVHVKLRDNSRSIKPLILFAGRFATHKGVNLLLEAFSEVYRELQEVRLLLIGGHASFTEESDIRIRARMQGVRIYPWIETGLLHKLMQKSWVVCVPSLYEPFGRVAAEAMALGTLVIASSVGGLKELLGDGQRGVLFKPNDPKAIALALINAFRNYDAFTTQIAEAQKYVQHAFNPNLVARQLSDTLTEVVL